MTNFDEIVTFARTGLNPRDNFKLGNGTNKYITIKNIKNNSLVIDKNTDVIDDEAVKLIHKRSQIKKGDVLFASIGRLGDMYIINEEPIGWDINESVFAFTLNTKLITQKYFYYLFKNNSVLDYLQRNSSGSTFKSIKMNQLKRMQFNLPPLETQKQIAANLDQVTKVIAEHKELLAKYDLLVKSRFIEMFGDVSTGHYRYETKKLGTVAEVGSSHRVFTNEFVEKGIPFYRGTEIGELANGNIPTDIYYISEEHYKKLASDETKPKIGDLLLPSICNKGQVWMVNTDEPFYYKDGRVLSISADRKIYNTKYLQYFMKEKTLVEYPKLGSGSTFAEFKIFLLKDIDVLTPPLPLQNQFAAFVQQIDSSKAVVQQSLQKAETLYKSLMQEYFG